MNADKRRLEIDQITERVIGCAYTVGNTLGCGFLEKVYENALVHEIFKAGFEVKQQHHIKVHYDNVVVGEYIADLLINDCVIIEIKIAKNFDNIHFAQCLNYLKATGLKICLLINYAKPKVEIRRVVNEF